MSIAKLSCPHCGAEVPEEQSYCPNCGRRLAPTTRGHSVARALAVIAFAIVGVPAGLAGGCLLLVSSGDVSTIALGLAGIALASGLAIYLAYVFRRTV